MSCPLNACICFTKPPFLHATFPPQNKHFFLISLSPPLKTKYRGVAQLGRALRSGLNHHTRRIIFEKSRKPLKTLTFSALPNVEKSSNLRSDHMFDHLQKNRIFLPFRGVAKVVSRIVRDDEIAGSSPVTSTKKQPKTSHFDLFSAVFLYIFHKIGYFRLTTCLP